MTDECRKSSEAIIESLVDAFQKSNEVFDLEKIVSKKTKKKKKHKRDDHGDGEKTKDSSRRHRSAGKRHKEKRRHKKSKKSSRRDSHSTKSGKTRDDAALAHAHGDERPSRGMKEDDLAKDQEAISSDDELPMGADFRSVNAAASTSVDGHDLQASTSTATRGAADERTSKGPECTSVRAEESFPLSKKGARVVATSTAQSSQQVDKSSEIRAKVGEGKVKVAAFVPRKVQLNAENAESRANGRAATEVIEGSRRGPPTGPLRGGLRTAIGDATAVVAAGEDDDDELQIGRPVIVPPQAAVEQGKPLIKIGQIGKISTPQIAARPGTEDGELAVSEKSSSSGMSLAEEDTDGEIEESRGCEKEDGKKSAKKKAEGEKPRKSKEEKKKNEDLEKKRGEKEKKTRRETSPTAAERSKRRKRAGSRSRSPLTPPAWSRKRAHSPPSSRRETRERSSERKRESATRRPTDSGETRRRESGRRRRSASRSPGASRVPRTSYRARSPGHGDRPRRGLQPSTRDKAVWSSSNGVSRTSRRAGGDERERRQARERARTKRRRSRSSSSSSSRSGSRSRRGRSRSRSAGGRARTKNADATTTHTDDDMKIDKKKLYEIARRNASVMFQDVNLQQQLASTLGADGIARLKSRGRSMEELVEYCKKLQKREERANRREAGETVSDDSEAAKSEDDFIHHPFELKPQAPITFSIPGTSMLPTRTPLQRAIEDGSQLRITYPVSSGAAHRDKDAEWTPVDAEKVPTVCETDKEKMKLAIPPSHKEKEKALSQSQLSTMLLPPPPQPPMLLPPPPAPILPPQTTLPSTSRANLVFADASVNAPRDVTPVVSERLNALKRVQADPNDFEARAIIADCDEKMKAWAESKHQPGLFTGSTGVAVLTPDQLEPTDPRFITWAKKDLFKTAEKVTSSVGLKLMQKMGWKPGEGLGKERDGTLEPLTLEVKSDRKGLLAIEEMPSSTRKSVTSTFGADMAGKHPVSVLMELCSKRHWGPPQFTCVESGPSHMRRFLWKAVVNGVEYQPVVPSGNKKTGKMQVAQVVLQSLGLVPRDAALPVVI